MSHEEKIIKYATSIFDALISAQKTERPELLIAAKNLFANSVWELAQAFRDYLEENVHGMAIVEMHRCGGCGKEFSILHDYCPECFRPKQDENARFTCKQCGKKVGAIDGATETCFDCRPWK